MKKLIFLILLLWSGICLARGIPASPPVGSDPEFDSVTTGSLVTDSITTGTPSSTEGLEVTIKEVQIENDVGETLTAWKYTVEMSDETDGTEDAIYREYVLVGGTLGMWRSTSVYTSEPVGSEAPVLGAVVWCDGATWDCSDAADGIMQQCWYDGDSWEKLGDPAD